MSNDSITGLTWDEGILQWQTLRQSKNGLQNVGEGSLASDPDPDIEAGETSASLSDLLQQARKEGEGFTKRVSFGLPAGQVLLRVVDLPQVDDTAELTSMVELQIDRLSPFPVETMSFSHEVLGSEDGMDKVLIAAVKRDVLQSIGIACEDARLRLTRVDVDVMAWWSEIREQYELAEEGLCLFVICDVAATHIIMTRDGVPAAFQSVNGQFGPAELAEEIQLEIGYLLSSTDQSDRLEAVSVELWGWGEPPQQLIHGLQTHLNMEVCYNELESLPPQAVGIAERALAQNGSGLNLFLNEWHAAGLSRRARKRIMKGAVVAVCIMVAALGMLYGYVLWENSRTQYIKDQIAVYKPLHDEQKSMDRRIRVLKSYLDKDRTAVECLLKVVEVMPDSGIELTLYDYHQKDGKVELVGRADLASIITTFSQGLVDQRFYADVELVYIKKSPRSSKNNFRIDLQLYKNEGEA